MKKGLGLFLLGTLSAAAGIGCFSAFLHPKAQKVEAASDISYVNFDEKGIVKLGEYPQNVVTTVSADDIKTNGVVTTTTGGNKYYTYHNKRYAIIENAIVDTEGSSGRILSNGDEINNYNGRSNVVIEFNTIEWQLLKVGKGNENIAYLISTNILDREIYNPSLSERVDYWHSSLFNYLNNNFKEISFSNDDLKYLAYGFEGLTKVQIDIPEKDDVDLDSYEDKNLKQASDYAILKNLTSHSAYNHGVGVPYLNAGYWLSTFSSDIDRIQVCWAKVAYSHCLMDDPKIGVRPVIQVNYKENQGGGGGSGTPSSKPSSGGGGNVTLGLGISFTIIGAGGLIAFFIVWAKKHSSGKPPIWIIVSLAGSLVISVAGLGCLGGGIKGGASGTVVGWYQGNMYDCVAWGERLAMNLTRDGKVYRYVADAWVDSAVNYKFILQPGVGSYSYGGGKLTITAASEWKLSSWETPVMTYTDCHGLGSFLKYEGYSGTAYSWYHYSNIDSNGIAEIRNDDTKDLKWA